MTPIDFPDSNITLTAPADMTEEQCNPLRAWYGEAEDGMRGFITAWKPSPEDIQALSRGEPLYLRVIGDGFPPVAMFTLNEKGEANL